MIDEMTVFEVEELAAYWHRHPPVHLLVAGFVGYRVDDNVALETPSFFPDHLPPQLLSIPGVESGMLPPGMPPAILDLDELMRQ